MVKTLPINFQVPEENKTISYNFIDIADGTGIVTLYGYHWIDNSTEKYGLSANAIRSNYIYTKATCDNSVTAEKEMDLDFDLAPFNLPQNLEGTARINLSFGAGSVSTANTSSRVYAIVKIRKWDGSTETEIASGQSETDDLGNIDGVGFFDYRTVNIQITVPLTHFQIGEQLRVTVEIWALQLGANDSSVFVFHSPNDELDTVANETLRWLVPTDSSSGYALQTSQLVAQIPFRTDQ